MFVRPMSRPNINFLSNGDCSEIYLIQATGCFISFGQTFKLEGKCGYSVIHTNEPWPVISYICIAGKWLQTGYYLHGSLLSWRLIFPEITLRNSPCLSCLDVEIWTICDLVMPLIFFFCSSNATINPLTGIFNHFVYPLDTLICMYSP